MRARNAAFLAVLGLTAACNAILGNEKRTLSPGAGSGGTDGGSAGRGGSSGKGGTVGGSMIGGEGGEETGGSAGSGKGGGGQGGTGKGGTSIGGTGDEAGMGGASDCTEGELRCSRSGEPEECEGGAWASLGGCDSATPVCLDGTCVVCAPGTFNCTGRRLDECIDGAWALKQNCPTSAPVCNEVAGECVDLVVTGGLTTLGPNLVSSPPFVVRGELSLQARVCDSGMTRCVRGGLVP